MNDRIIALAAFLAFFVWIWSTEHENRAARFAHRTAATRLASSEDSPTVPAESMAAPTYDAEPNSIAVENADCAIPLPDGIPPGHYVVLDCRGVTRHIEVTPAQIEAAHSMRPMRDRDYYVKVLDGRHWIFERVRAVHHEEAETPSPAVAATEPQQMNDSRVPVQWGPWLRDVGAQAAKAWAEQRQRLSKQLRMRRATAQGYAGPLRKMFRRVGRQVEAAPTHWWERFLATDSEDEIASPESSGRAL